MAFAALSRRTFLRHVPAAAVAVGAVAGAIAVPALAAPTVHTITDKQAAAIAAWQIAVIEAAAQWEVYCTTGKGGWEQRASDAEYLKWKSLHDEQDELHIAMTKAFYPFDRVSKTN